MPKDDDQTKAYERGRSRARERGGGRFGLRYQPGQPVLGGRRAPADEKKEG